MPKTTFVRKPCTLDDVRTGAEWIENRHGGKPIDSYYIAKELQLEENEFFALHEDLVSDREWIEEFSNHYPADERRCGACHPGHLQGFADRADHRPARFQISEVRWTGIRRIRFQSDTHRR